MTKEELINHLEHLAKYVKYSEDAPALMEAIKMLKCSEMPNGSDERTQKCTKTHACDLIDRREAIEALFDWEMTYDWDDHCREEDPKPAYIVSPSDVIEHLPSAQPEAQLSEESTTSDCISRQAAIDLFPNDTLEWDTKGGYIAPHLARQMIEELPFTQLKPLKYSGTSICCYCKTTDCDGCLYEPMAERREE